MALNLKNIDRVKSISKVGFYSKLFETAGSCGH